MNKTVITLLCLLTFAASSVGAAGEDTQADRITATKAYLKIVPAEKMARNMISEMIKGIPVEQRAETEKSLKVLLDPQFLESVTLETMPKHFSANEINALTRFYASPEGASIMQKFGAYMADLMPAIMNQVLKSMQAK